MARFFHTDQRYFTREEVEALLQARDDDISALQEDISNLQGVVSTLQGDVTALENVIAGYDAGWTPVVGSISAQSGTLGNANFQYRYKRIGTVVHLVGKAAVGDSGTASGVLICGGVPASRNSTINFVGAGRETNATGRNIVAVMAGNSTSIVLSSMDNAAYVGSGHVYDFVITYEVSP